MNVYVHDDEDGEALVNSGTSFAAPAVAGILATYLNYEPWGRDKSGIERMKQVKRWIKTSGSSWERNKDPDPDKPNIKVNMVSAEPGPPSAASHC